MCVASYLFIEKSTSPRLWTSDGSPSPLYLRVRTSRSMFYSTYKNRSTLMYGSDYQLHSRISCLAGSYVMLDVTPFCCRGTQQYMHRIFHVHIFRSQREFRDGSTLKWCRSGFPRQWSIPWSVYMVYYMDRHSRRKILWLVIRKKSNQPSNEQVTWRRHWTSFTPSVRFFNLHWKRYMKIWGLRRLSPEPSNELV